MNKALAGIAVAASLAAAVFGTLYFDQSATFGMLPNYQSTLTNGASFTSGKVTVNQFLLGPMTASTSSATTTVLLQKGLNWGMALGDQCGVQLTSATSTLGFSGDGFITAIAATNASVTVTFFNGSNSVLTVQTGTLKVNCNHY